MVVGLGNDLCLYGPTDPGESFCRISFTAIFQTAEFFDREFGESFNPRGMSTVHVLQFLSSSCLPLRKKNVFFFYINSEY